MPRGYDRSLYLLPFDHRHSYVTGMFDLTPPLTEEERQAVSDSKHLIYEGFRGALGQGLPVGDMGILVDEEFGAEILIDAARHGYVTALCVEKSGSVEFVFEYGAAFAEHIEAFAPTLAKALVHYNPEGDLALNERQIGRLRQLSNYCQAVGQLFMFELLVPATEQQRARAEAVGMNYDLTMRPELTVEAITTLQDAGIEPDIWKIEGFDRREDCERVVATARHHGRSEVGCIVLGRGADSKEVTRWLELAASVTGFVGFAVGRTTFWDAVADFLAKRATRDEAIARIASRFSEWTAIFERARQGPLMTSSYSS